MAAAVFALGASSLAVSVPGPVGAAPPESMVWRTVINNGDTIPGTEVLFNSYNQPSINTSGLVVFRGRGRGGSGGEPPRGIYARDMGHGNKPLRAVVDVSSEVPAPNNLGSSFNEFPSIPRIAADSDMIATRGQSEPVYEYIPEGEVESTRVGTAGIYATLNGQLVTGASQLGAVPGFEYWAVPGASAGTRFSQFPGSPAVDGTTIAFKGNYTDLDNPEESTGVFIRDLSVTESPVERIASAGMQIPGEADGVVFGSTAPPSAANGIVVFLGVDDEEVPTAGGLFSAPMESDPDLTPLVQIGDPVPGKGENDTFTKIGEGLSFDGRFVAFWGTWGDETREVELACPEDGNQDIIDECLRQFPSGSTTVTVSVHEGMFVHDLITGDTTMVAENSVPNGVTAMALPEAPDFESFLYWVFSGAPPTAGSEEDADQELPRWRSSAFTAVSQRFDGTFRVAFKGSGVDGGQGIYLATGVADAPLLTLVDTGSDGRSIDREAPEGSLVTTVGIEREGFRGNYLAISVSMANAEESWAGVYVSALRSPYRPLGPVRLMETRTGTGLGTVDGRQNGVGVRPGDSVTVLEVAGRGGVPDDASAVALNVTAVDASTAGFVTVYPCETIRPNVSTLNVATRGTTANNVVTALGADGTVCIYTQRSTDLVVDLAGYFPEYSFEAPESARLLETRTGSGLGTVDGLSNGLGRLGATSVTEIVVAGRAGVPADAAAAAVNLTIVDPAAAGYATMFPCDDGRPNVSTINFVANETVANGSIVKLSAQGTVCLFTTVGTHALLDVTGSFTHGSSFEALSPARVMETRVGEGLSTVDGLSNGMGRLAGASVTTLQITGRADVPADAGAVALNVTAVGPGAAGYVTVYPCGAERPNASTLNFSAGEIVANGVITPLADDGTVCLYAQRATDLVVDVNGYFPGS